MAEDEPPEPEPEPEAQADRPRMLRYTARVGRPRKSCVACGAKPPRYDSTLHPKLCLSCLRASGMEWKPTAPTSAYALIGYAKELGLSRAAKEYAEHRVLKPTDPARQGHYECQGKVQAYMQALVHVAAGRSLSSFDTPARMQGMIGDAAELLELLWRRARFKVGDYINPDGTPDIDAIKSAPPGVFSGLEVFETETRSKDGQVTVNRRWNVPPSSPETAQALLAKVLALGHVNDPTATVQVNQTVVIQALSRMSEGGLKELLGVLSAPAQPALQGPQAGVEDAQLVSPTPESTPDHGEPPEPLEPPEPEPYDEEEAPFA